MGNTGVYGFIVFVPYVYVAWNVFRGLIVCFYGLLCRLLCCAERNAETTSELGGPLAVLLGKS